MKKYFMFIITALLVLIVAPKAVFADDEGDGWISNVSNTIIRGTDGPNSVVGNVETTYYNVSIEWGSKTFDWVYNIDTGVYEWDGTGTLTVNDDTVNGYVTPSLSWTSESKYSATSASFFYTKGNYTKTNCQLVETIEELNMMKDFFERYPHEGGFYTDSECTFDNLVLDNDNLNRNNLNRIYADFGTGFDFPLHTSFSGQVPDEARICKTGEGIYCLPEYGYTYDLGYTLVLDRTKTINRPSQGDVIGHYTITFATH